MWGTFYMNVYRAPSGVLLRLSKTGQGGTILPLRREEAHGMICRLLDVLDEEAPQYPQ